MAEQHWLLLRGLCRESRHWGNFPELMQKQMQDTRVSCIDLPGNGKYCRQQTPTDTELLVEQLHHHYHREQPVYLLGLSLGGMLAYQWMQRYPEDLRGIVMVNSSLAPYNSWSRRLQPTALPQLLKAICQKGFKREQTIYDLTCRSQARRAETLTFWQIYQLENPVSFSNFIRQLKLAMHCKAQQQIPKRPVLLLSGAQDQLVNPLCSVQLAEQWNMPHFQHKEAGHDLPHDQPQWLIGQLEQWLRS